MLPNANNEHDIPAWSRSGKSHPLGKCDTELKAMVPEQLKVDFERAAYVLGDNKTPSEYLRDLATSHLYGVVPEDTRGIVWAYACQETQNPFLLKLLRIAIFGVHEASLDAQAQQGHGNNTAHS